MAAYVGTGATLTFGTAGPAYEIINITSGDQSVPLIDISHQGSTGSRAKTTGDLIDEGDVTFDCHFDRDLADAAHTALGVSQTITIKFPLEGGSTQGQVTGTGAVTSHSWGIPLDDKQTCTFTITWLGAATYSDES